ncbi:hypothetical protein EYF80_032210 [Liparis tanakae]|uniref:Uncharacterized protein n=1 Tax=Liparis tanakae TaxID=230148 RepID=A0A4Z2GVL6_9TELE|nr:hypothetical protein EYF80_032210 [Liparis tanakae]
MQLPLQSEPRVRLRAATMRSTETRWKGRSSPVKEPLRTGKQRAKKADACPLSPVGSRQAHAQIYTPAAMNFLSRLSTFLCTSLTTQSAVDLVEKHRGQRQLSDIRRVSKN